MITEYRIRYRYEDGAAVNWHGVTFLSWAPAYEVAQLMTRRGMVDVTVMSRQVTAWIEMEA